MVVTAAEDTAAIFRIKVEEESRRRGSFLDELKQSLNGIWKFQYSVNAKKRPVSFYENGYDISGFDEIQVPQHIELAGYDKIHYINTMYPWEGHEYRRPAGTCNHIGEGMFSEASYNPTGSYVRFFDLEEALIGKRVILSFEGAEQAIYVWINGEFVGYAEDSFTVSEFDITPYVKETGNLCRRGTQRNECVL